MGQAAPPHVDLPAGLTSHEAEVKREADGPNELPATQPRSLAAIAFAVVREPMFLMLIGAAILYFLIGDSREALVLAASVGVIIAIAFHQERKSERALEALRELSSPRTLVLRDAEWRRIAGRDVVRGDIVQLREGDRVPADGILLRGDNVVVDESLLTGESVPVSKHADATTSSMTSPGGEGSSSVFSGSLVTQGVGIASVKATGEYTALGRIGKSLKTLEPEPTGVEQETRRAIVIFASLGLALCTVITLTYRWLRGDWLEALLAGITLAMANVPEEFPVVLTVFLALGAWRISRQKVLTRRPAAIEMLGATTVLCVDKTGTLTENRMVVVETWTLTECDRLDSAANSMLLRYGLLASEPTPVDPMDTAFHDAAEIEPPLAGSNGDRVHAYPLRPDQLSVAHIWDLDETSHEVAVKGAPEAVIAMCKVTDAERAAIEVEAARMGARGLRVIAVAGGRFPRDSPFPLTQRELPVRFVGLAALADPVRPSVPAALAECYAAGVRTVMITGDYPVTARAIAAQIGLRGASEVVTGEALSKADDAGLRELARTVNVFARVVPEQKLRLVQALKANGEIVAMTGDGVNDAPALKAAHIGVAMGKRGSDVAREVSALVLLEDDFTSLVEAVRLGRRIYANIRSAMRYIVAVHVPTAGLALVPILLGWPLVLFPVHVVFLEFVIDPACSVVFEGEPAASNTMRRPPRSRDARLFDLPMIGVGFAQGLLVLIAILLLYGWGIAHHVPEAQARAMAFTALVFGNVSLVFANRPHAVKFVERFAADNRALWLLVGAALAGLAAVLYVEPLNAVFRFAPLDLAQIALGAAAGVSGPIALAAADSIFRRRRSP